MSHLLFLIFQLELDDAEGGGLDEARLCWVDIIWGGLVGTKEVVAGLGS